MSYDWDRVNANRSIHKRIQERLAGSSAGRVDKAQEATKNGAATGFLSVALIGETFTPPHTDRVLVKADITQWSKKELIRLNAAGKYASNTQIMSSLDPSSFSVKPDRVTCEIEEFYKLCKALGIRKFSEKIAVKLKERNLWSEGDIVVPPPNEDISEKEGSRAGRKDHPGITKHLPGGKGE